MKKIKVLHLLVSRTYNGAENVVCQIADLFKKDDSIEIVYCSLDGPVREALDERGIEFVPVDSLSVKDIRKVVKKVSPTIIHAHDMRANVLAYLSRTGIPVISHIHNNNFDSRGLSLKSLLFYAAAHKAKHIFWVSKTSFDGYYFKKSLSQKSEILYNVINVNNLNNKVTQDTNNYDYDFVYLGRLTYQKNPERLIDIMEKTIKKNPKIKFAILGDGDLTEVVENLIQTKQLNKQIAYLGFSNNPYKILKCSKGMLMSSRWEGLPMCALESIALGVPVISTPADGLKEIIVNDENGFLSENDDEIVNRLLKLYEDKGYQKHLSEGAYQKTSEIMNLDNYKSAIKRVYQKYSM